MDPSNLEDDDPALTSYTPRSVTFSEDTESTELSGQKNLTDDVRTKITHLESLGCGVIGSVRSVTYGTWKGSPACLISLNFNFRSSTGPLRLKSAEISISFQQDFKNPPPPPPATSEDTQPILRNFSPRKIYGISNPENRTYSYQISLQTNVPSSPFPLPTPSSTISKSSSYTKDHRLSIIGQPWSSRNRQEAHQVLWTIKEAGKLGEGIPDEVNVGMVVSYSGTFEAAVEVRGKLGMGLSVSAPPWGKDEPLLFNGRTEVGERPRGTVFDELEDGDWKGIAPYREEWDNVIAAV